MANSGQSKRRDSNRVVLRSGESQRANGSYDYRWVGKDGKRHSIYAKTLDELREKEKKLEHDRQEGIKRETRLYTVNDVYEMWTELKRGLKDNTFQGYKYMYRTFVQPQFGRKHIAKIRKSDVKKFYNSLADERGLKASTIDGIHTVLHQVFELAVDDNIIRNNPSDNALKELKASSAFRSEKRRALTMEEQNLFLDYVKSHPLYSHWYPVFAVLIGTGLRVGECTGLRWCDIDLENNVIDVNHTLVYYNHEVNGCYFNIHTPKTEAGRRTVPMMESVREAFLMERDNQELAGIYSEVQVDGYTDFIFLNRFGNLQHQGALNKAIKRIIRDCNDEVITAYNEAVEEAGGPAKASKVPEPVLLPNFSCHSLRHTFTTRMCEAGVNVKVIQDALGHADISTTLNIYADATRDLKQDEFGNLEDWLNRKRAGEKTEPEDGEDSTDGE